MHDNAHDLTGLKCPLPIVRLARIIKAMTPGEECTLHADDPAFCPDVEAWCRKTGNLLIRCDDVDGRAMVVIRKGDQPSAQRSSERDHATAGDVNQCPIARRERAKDG